MSDELEDGIKWIYEYEDVATITVPPTASGQLTWKWTLLDDGSVPSYLAILDQEAPGPGPGPGPMRRR